MKDKHKTRKAIRQEKQLLNVRLSDKQATEIKKVLDYNQDFYVLNCTYIIHHGPTMPEALVELGMAFFEKYKEDYTFISCKGLYHPLSEMHICPTENDLVASLYQKPKGYRLVVTEEK